MNLEFDFELHILHATHKALGLGWQIYLKAFGHMLPTTNPYKMDASTCNQNVALEENHFYSTFITNGMPLGSIGSIKEARKGPKELLLGPLEVPR